MPKITYSGGGTIVLGFDAPPLARGAKVEPGTTIEVSKEQAEELLARPEWDEAKTSSGASRRRSERTED